MKRNEEKDRKNVDFPAGECLSGVEESEYVYLMDFPAAAIKQRKKRMSEFGFSLHAAPMTQMKIYSSITARRNVTDLMGNDKRNLLL